MVGFQALPRLGSPSVIIKSCEMTRGGIVRKGFLMETVVGFETTRTGGVRSRTSRILRVTAWLALMVLTVGMVACSGGGGSGSASPLSAPLGATVTDSLGRAPDNVINSETVSAVEVEIELGPDSLATDEVTVTLSDGQESASSGQIAGQGAQAATASATVPGTDGAGFVTVGPIDASGLMDGPLSMTVTISRNGQELSTTFENALILDASPPVPATAFDVPATESSPAGVANASSSAAFAADVSFPAAAAAADLCTLFFSDGQQVVESLTENVVPGGSVTFTGINLQGLSDGSLQVTVRVQDVAENNSDIMATVSKDSSVPQVVSARVLAGDSNAADAINGHNELGFKVEVTLADGAAGDRVALVLRDSAMTTFEVAAVDAPLGGGSFLIDASSFNLIDGQIDLDVVVTDSNGNSQTTAGIPVTKDMTLSGIVIARFRSFESEFERSVIAAAVSASVYFTIDFDQNLSGLNETVDIHVTSESGQFLTFGPFALAFGQAQSTHGPFDLSSLTAGELILGIRLKDDHGNQLSLRGQSARLDLDAHPGHNTATALPTAGNLINQISAASSTAVTMRVDAMTYQGDDVRARAFLSDGVSEVLSSSLIMPRSGGQVDFIGIDASMLSDGPISIQIRYVDAFGNRDDYPGSQTYKDTQISLPTAAFVAATNSNDQGVINGTSVSSVRIDVSLPAETRSGDRYALSIGDGSSSVDFGSLPASGGAQTLSFSGLNLTPLGDGEISITLSCSDKFSNQGSFVGAPAMKDSSAPLDFLSLNVEAGDNNRYDEINGSNLVSQSIIIKFDAATAPNDLYDLIFSDGNQKRTAEGLTVVGPGTHSVKVNLDLSQLVDGPIQIGYRIYDTVGNETTGRGSVATKTTVTTIPTSAIVAASGNNAQDIINSASQATTSVEVVMPAGTLADDEVTVRLRGGGRSVDSTPQMAVAGGGLMTFAFDASSLDEGVVQVTAKVSNPRGTGSNFRGTPAFKDSIAPAVVPSIAFDLGHDGFINAAEAPSFGFSGSFAGNSDGSEMVTLTINDGATDLVIGPAALAAGANLSISYAGTSFASLADASLTYSLDVADPAGNVTSASGAFATLDTAAPGSPASIEVTAGAGNGLNVINISSVGTTSIVFATNPGEEASATADVSLVGTQTLAFNDIALTNIGGNEPTIVLDSSGQADGQLTLSISLKDPAGNAGSPVTVMVDKDTVAPTAVLAVSVPVGGSNPVDFVNDATKGAAMIDVAFGPDSVITDNVILTISDSINQTATPSQAAPNGSVLVGFGPFDLTTFNDGALTLSIELTDVFGNVSTSMDVDTVKDTIAPDQPTTLDILSSADNNAGFVTLATQNSVEAIAIFPNTMTGNETATLTIGSVNGLPQNVAQNGGPLTFPGLGLSAELDGVLALSVLITEPSGNTAVFVGVLPTKDTVLPELPTMALVPMTAGNPADFINIASQSNVQVDVSWSGTADVTDSANVVLSDGVNGSSSPSLNPVQGATTNHFVNSSALNDGLLTMTVEIVDAAGNRDTFTSGMPPTRDTATPEIPTAATLVETSFNFEGFISNSSQNMVAVEVNWPAATVGTESAIIELGDGTLAVQSSSLSAPVGGGLQTYTVNATTLAEGVITVRVDVTSAGGNPASFNAANAEKDVTAPFTPSNAQIITSGSNPAGVINSSTQNAVQVEVTWPVTAAVSDQATVKITVGATEVISAMLPANPGNVVTYSIDASSLAEGAITMTVDVLDQARNDNVFVSLQGDKDTVSPANPNSASVIVSGSNNADEINFATANAVQVSVDWTASAEVADDAIVTLFGGASQAASSSQNSTPGALQNYNLVTAALPDGAITMIVEITDPNGNVNTFPGTMATKDTVAPELPTASSIIDSGPNPVNIINGSNVGAVEIDAIWSPTADATDDVVLTISDGTNSQASAMTNPTPGAAQRFTLDASGLNDGAVSISLDATDAFGNVATHTGTAATKDLTDPLVPTAAVVMAGGNNAQGIINTFNEGAVQIEVTWPAGSDATDSATVMIDDGAGGTFTSSSSVVNPGGTTTYSVDASGLADGGVTVVVDVVDVALNTDQSIHLGATKDATAPSTPTAASILLGGSNDANVINAASAGAVSVDVTWPAGVDTSDTAVVVLISGGMEAMSASANQIDSATANFTIDASGLPDGPVSVEVRSTDAAGNSSTGSGIAGVKDVAAPDLPTSFGVDAGAGNDANVINVSNEATVSVTVNWGATSSANDTAIVTLTTAGTSLPSASMAASPSGTTVYTFDTSTLLQGAVVVSIAVEDENRNPASGNGTAAAKDTVLPTNATAGAVIMTGDNAVNIINSASSSMVMISVDWPAGADALDNGRVVLGDGSTTVPSPMQSVNPGNTVTYPMDASSLGDGNITVSVVVEDANRNEDTFAGTMASKDTSAPVGPTAALIPMTGNNPVSVVNSANEGAVGVDVTWDGNADAADTVIVRLSDGTLMADSASTNPTPSAMQGFMANASALAEGSISVQVVVTDAAGNETTIVGTTALKDTASPTTPMTASVSASSNNAADFISDASKAMVDVQVMWTAMADATDTAKVTLTDSGAGSASSATANPTPGMVQTFAVDASLLAAGAITLTVEIDDVNQNSAVFIGTAATLDITAPTDPTSAQVVAGGSNPADFINNQNEAMVMVDVIWPGGSDDTAMAKVIISDGSAQAMSADMAISSSSTVTYAVDTSALADGPVTVSVESKDPALNAATFAGTPASKNSTPPEAPSLFQVAAGVDNAPNQINVLTEGAVNFAVNYALSSESSDQVTMTMSDGSNVFVIGPLAARQGSGIEVYSANDLSALLDGDITLSIEIEDTAGNVLTSNGTAAFKDTATGNATAAAVASGAGNSADFLNASNFASATVSVTMDGDSGGEDVFVTLGDGSATVQSATMVAASGGGVLTFAGIDTTSLSDTAISITVTTTDSQSNMQTFVGTPAAKDITAPVAPTAASVIDSGSNDPNQINLSNESAVSVEVTWPVVIDDTDTFQVTLNDGSGSVQSGPVTVQTGGGMQTVVVDVSGLADVAVMTIAVDTTDAAGNVDAFSGTDAFKDTTVVAVSTTSIAVSPSNNVDTISGASAGSVQVDVVFAAGADGTETVIVTLADSNGANPDVVGGPQNLPNGQTTMSFAGLDASGLDDGSISVVVTVSDDQGNDVDGATLTAPKDVVDPMPATAGAIPSAAGNSADFVAIANESSVSVNVTLPASSVTTDTVTVTLDDGSNSVMGTVAGFNGAGNVTVSGINASSLNESALTLDVLVTDVAGNTSSVFSGMAATKDVSAPADPIVDPVTTPFVHVTQAVTGTSEADAAIAVTGGASAAAATADANGFYTADVSLAVDAVNTLSIMATDAAGNPSGAVTVDFNAANLVISHSSTAPVAPFSNQTVAYGLGSAGSSNPGGAFADFDNDGDLDLFIGSSGEMFEFTGAAFSDITIAAGGPFACNRSVVWGDYDNDGDVDLLTVDTTTGTTLLRNNFIGLGTKTFTDVTATETAGVASATLQQALWLDQNGDGYLDFLVLDGALNANVLMVNQRGAGSPTNTFAADATTGVNSNIAASSRGVVADFDVDGDIDVLFGDSSPSVFYRNDGASFTDIAGVAGGSGVDITASTSGVGICFVDYDNDGDFDVFVNGDTSGGSSKLWVNTAGTFVEQGALAGFSGGETGGDAVWGDFDNDGILDFYMTEDGPNYLYRGLGDTNADNIFEFVDVAGDTGIAVDLAGTQRHVLMDDIDADGDLDILVNNAGGVVFFRNDLVSARYLHVRVSGTGTGAGTASSDARGAVVQLTDLADNILATREINGGRGNGAQNSELIHFGGIAPSWQYKVKVTFPSGSVKTVTVTPRLETNQLLTIAE